MTQDMIEGGAECNPPFASEGMLKMHGLLKQDDPEVKFVLEPGAILPEYSEELASGMDVFSLNDVDLTPFKVTRVETGLRLAYLAPDYEIQVRSRSGNTLKKNYFVANQPGTVDASYRGFCDVLLVYIPPFVWNQPEADFRVEFPALDPVLYKGLACRHCDPDMDRPIQIKRGDKIAQFVVCPVLRPKIVAVKEITSITKRMDTGFGDSGDRSIKEAKPFEPGNFNYAPAVGIHGNNRS
jgi:dUTP pyrophosphatase